MPAYDRINGHQPFVAGPLPKIPSMGSGVKPPPLRDAYVDSPDIADLQRRVAELEARERARSESDDIKRRLSEVGFVFLGERLPHGAR